MRGGRGGGRTGRLTPFPSPEPSLALGALTASPGLAPAARLALGTGFCGGFTTFSTFSVEAVQLLERGRLGLAALHAALNVGGGVAACALGMLLAGAAKG